ncbi:MAG: hypothetical protein JSV65_13565 [Armatimonadota bacterium]|nr:MAG: hypothetical protein JSV65_13565 [Armatimonadota bacterium]
MAMSFTRVLLVAVIAATTTLCAFAQEVNPGMASINVRDFGAKGDGETDDTEAFQRALDAAAAAGGGIVQAGVGNYLIKTHLTIPDHVTLNGVWTTPTAWSQHKGTTLLAVEGEGSEDGPPFISLGTNSVLKGVTVFYPNQKADAIKPYPWCVACRGGDNASIVDCLLVNPYLGVDFGTRPAGRHYIRNLYGQPLRKGIFVDQCYDVGRIENVHLWPFWNGDDKVGAVKFNREHGEAFIFGRTDWEYVTNTFNWGYKTGYRFIQTEAGATNGNFLGIGSDANETCVLVEASQPYGLLITNGEFVAFLGDEPVEVSVLPTNAGSVQFQNCAFWGPAHHIASIAGRGVVTFNNCHFQEWADGVPAIQASEGSLSVIGCTFSRESPQVELREAVRSAVIMGNQVKGKLDVRNDSAGAVEIGLNAAFSGE